MLQVAQVCVREGWRTPQVEQEAAESRPRYCPQHHPRQNPWRHCAVFFVKWDREKVDVAMISSQFMFPHFEDSTIQFDLPLQDQNAWIRRMLALKHG